jgi:hypothetical protein
MRHRPAGDFIPNFDVAEADIAELVQDAPASPAAPAIAPIELPAFLSKPPREPAVDTAQIFEDGRQAGLAEAQLGLDEQLAHLQAEHTAALQSARQAWADEVATLLAAQIPQALDTIGDRIADTVGRLLRPFLEVELRDAASRALIAQITPLLNGTDGAPIRISGPALLLETLRRVFASQGSVTFAENDATEVSIQLGETMIETRIAPWIARLEGHGPDRRRKSNAA